MTPDEVQAHFDLIEATQRETADRYERLAVASERRTAELLAAVAAPPLPPPPPGRPSGGLPSFGPRPTPAVELGNGPPLSRDRLMELGLERKAREADRRAYFEREQAAIIAHVGRLPKSPPVRRAR